MCTQAEERQKALTHELNRQPLIPSTVSNSWPSNHGGCASAVAHMTNALLSCCLRWDVQLLTDLDQELERVRKDFEALKKQEQERKYDEKVCRHPHYHTGGTRAASGVHRH